jgi:3-deoxy-7-phosphoheptulonate synthase
MPVGFKNGTDGTVQIAVDAIGSSLHPHRFLSVTKQGVAAIVETRGNDACHVILRGGSAGPNYSAGQVAAALALLESAGLPQRLMIDCSHANSQKDHTRQPEVVTRVAGQIADGNERIFGVMLESFLLDGNQALGSGADLTYGLSVTDECMSWERTQPLFEVMAQAVRDRRKSQR